MGICFLFPGNFGAAPPLLRDTAVSQRGPSEARSSSQMPSLSSVGVGTEGRGIWGGGRGWRRWGPCVPRMLAPSQYQPGEVGVGLEDKDALWAPFSPPPPSGHRCGMETPPTSWDTLFPQAGLTGRGQGKGQRRRLPASRWAAAYTQAVSWRLALPPAPPARCAGGSGSCRAPAGLLLALLSLGTKRDSWGGGGGDSGPLLKTRCLISPLPDFSLGPTATSLNLRSRCSCLRGKLVERQGPFGPERTVPWRKGR